MTPAPPVRQARPAAQRGMVLAAVLWVVAALALLAAALAGTARAELGALTAARAAAQAEAIGDAVLQMAVVDLKAPPPDAQVGRRKAEQGRLVRDYVFDDTTVSVRITPVAGLVDLNGAPEELLAAMFGAADLQPDAATALAQRVMDWRDSDQTPQPQGAEDDAYAAAGTAARPRNDRFLVPEDLLQVLGMTYETYLRVRPLITVDSGAAGIDPASAPPEVLALLAHGDRARADALAAAFASGDPVVDTTGLEARWVARGGGAGIRRFEAVVPMPDGRRMVRTWWVDMEKRMIGGPQWRILRAEPAAAETASAGEPESPQAST